MSQLGYIKHKGTVVSVEHGVVKVLINSASACSGCHLEKSCTSLDTRDKYIEAYPKGVIYKEGEIVSVCCSEEQGFYALFFAYILPIVLLLTVLFLGYIILKDELKAGLLSLSVLPPYYLLLYLYRHFFRDKLHIKLIKEN